MGITTYAVLSSSDVHHCVLVTLMASLRVFDAFEDVYMYELRGCGLCGGYVSGAADAFE